MTNDINALIAEGMVVTQEMLNALSPYHTGRINRFGIFYLAMDKEKLSIDAVSVNRTRDLLITNH